MRIKKSIFSMLLVFSILISSILPSSVMAKDIENFNDVESKYGNLSKKIIGTGSKEDEYIVELSATGADVKEKMTTDIMFVVDVSGSMDYTLSQGNNKKRIDIEKEAMTNFVNNLDDPNTRVGIVEYDYDARYVQAFSNDKNELLNSINSLKPQGATYTYKGIRLAGNILNGTKDSLGNYVGGSNADRKVMVLLTDGDPSTASVMTNFKDNTGEIRDTKYRKAESQYAQNFTGYEYPSGDSKNIALSTMSEAIRVKKQNTEVYSVSIGLYRDDYKYLETMGYGQTADYLHAIENIATNENNVYHILKNEEFNFVLNDIANKSTKTISNGKIEDPMGKNIKLVSDKKVDNLEDLKNNGGYLLEVEAKDEATKKKILEDLKIEIKDNKINVTGLNLGKDEKFSIKYLVKLNTLTKDFNESEKYPANKKTTLTPNVSNKETVEFNVPNIYGAEKDNPNITLSHLNEDGSKDLSKKKIEENGKFISEVKMPKDLVNVKELTIDLNFDDKLNINEINKEDIKFLNNINIPQENIEIIKYNNSFKIIFKESENFKLRNLEKEDLNIEISYNLKEEYKEESVDLINKSKMYYSYLEDIVVKSNELELYNSEKVKYGNLTVKKIVNGIDSNENFEFEILDEDNNIVKEFTLANNESQTFELLFGDYKVIEKENENYETSYSKESIKLSEDNKDEVIIVNNDFINYENNFILTKIDSENNPLEGVEFTIYRKIDNEKEIRSLRNQIEELKLENENLEKEIENIKNQEDELNKKEEDIEDAKDNSKNLENEEVNEEVNIEKDEVEKDLKEYKKADYSNLIEEFEKRIEINLGKINKLEKEIDALNKSSLEEVARKETDEFGKIKLILDQGDYLLEETKALPGYKNTDKKIDFTVKNKREVLSFNIVNKQYKDGGTQTDDEKIDLNIKKIWTDKPQDMVKIIIYANGEKFDEIILNNENNWNETVEVNKYDKNYKEINYSVKEDGVNSENALLINNHLYYVNIIEDENNFTIENKFDRIIDKNTGTLLDLKINVKWLGKEQDKVDVILYKDGKEENRYTISKEEDWKMSEFIEYFKNSSYSIKEVGENNNILNINGTKYKVEVTGDALNGYTIVNTEIKEDKSPEKPEEKSSSNKSKKRNKKENIVKEEKENKNIEKENFAYVHGYPDGSFRPENGITRAEASAIFARVKNHRLILSEDYINKYSDVLEKEWYSKYIAHLDSEKVIEGYADGTFKPNSFITRAEFVTMLSRFEGIKSKDNSFNDTKDHWASDSINAVKEMDLVKGYSNGEFRPDSYITREEVVTIMNSLLNRNLDKPFAYNNKEVVSYTDVEKTRWSHDDIIEASSSYIYTGTKENAKWTRLLEIK